MTTKYLWIEGRCKWPHIYPETMDTKYGENYSIEIYLSAAAIAALKELGWRGKLKEDEGGVFAKFNRKNQQQFKTGLETLGPPKVTDYETKEEIGYENAIGNGSLVNILIEVYPSSYGTGSRLKEVLVKELVPYVKNTDSSEIVPL